MPARRRARPPAHHPRETAPRGSGTSPRQHFPAATQIVDLYHAREHLHELGEDHRIHAGRPASDEWLAQRLADLDDGDIPALLAAARALPLASRKARDRDKALHYFETNAHRMHYAWYRDHWACSSGPAPSKPAASPSSASGSSCLACAGPNTEPQESSCWAELSVGPGRMSGWGNLPGPASRFRSGRCRSGAPPRASRGSGSARRQRARDPGPARCHRRAAADRAGPAGGVFRPDAARLRPAA